MPIEFVIVLTLATATGFYGNRRLQSANASILPYRYGYALAALLAIVSVMAAVEVVQVMGEGSLSVTGLLGATLAPLAVYGIVRRRRSGWWVLTTLVVLFGALVATLIGLSSTIAATVAIVLTGAIVALNFRYVRRRLEEFERGATGPAAAKTESAKDEVLQRIESAGIEKAAEIDSLAPIENKDATGTARDPCR